MVDKECQMWQCILRYIVSPPLRDSAQKESPLKLETSVKLTVLRCLQLCLNHTAFCKKWINALYFWHLK